ncbi:hypothetical protein KJ567_05400, partial [Candidatus Bipolaricaulota bacterium]|nr:hypothetical protein [Candidatus Bipolaricaulota bacterium]
DVRPTPVDGSFHLGKTLAKIVRGTDAQSVLYFGSGSGSLLEKHHIATLFEFAEAQEGALFNNFYSCDFAVITDRRALLEASLPSEDNGFGFALAEAGAYCYTLPRDAASQFDIDVPTDLHLLKHFGRGGDAVQGFLRSWATDHPTLGSVCSLLTDRRAVVYLAGRIQPGTWQSFELATACRTGGFIEGRGMKASPNGRSTLLRAVTSDDPVRFFRRLAEAADGAILDTRPLLATGGELPPARDRFASDLFLPGEIADPRWRAFTEAAMGADVPVVLGGHNLVSGGLLLLANECWKGRDLPRRLHPESFDWKRSPDDAIP